MQHEPLDTSNTINNTDEEQNKGGYLIKREPIERTPFYVILGSEGMAFIALGKHKISAEWETEGELLEEAKNVLENDHWNIYMHMTVLLAEMVYQSNQEETI
jgi:hypothetical protein